MSSSTTNEQEDLCEYLGCENQVWRDTDCCNTSYCSEHYAEFVMDRECLEQLTKDGKCCTYSVQNVCENCWEGTRDCGH
jgi:hypothetical protein